MEITVIPPDVKYIYRELPWLALSAFVGAIITAMVSLWYGKKINKDSENKTIDTQLNPEKPQ